MSTFQVIDGSGVHASCEDIPYWWGKQYPVADVRGLHVTEPTLKRWITATESAGPPAALQHGEVLPYQQHWQKPNCHHLAYPGSNLWITSVDSSQTQIL